MNEFTVRAHTNIALIKYWGKADVALNIPTTSSLSMTLCRFGSFIRRSFVIADAAGLSYYLLAFF